MAETYLVPLFLTILLEETAALLMGLRGKDLLAILLVNVVTNPLLVTGSILLMYHMGVGTGQILTYLILEPCVIYAEYRLFKAYLSVEKDPLTLSLLLNIVSVTGGIVWQTVSRFL